MIKLKISAWAAVCLLGVSAFGAVRFRGVVEGYYGRPWGTQGRISILKFMGERDLNTFIYGPKDDPYHHEKWREPYPDTAMRDFSKLLMTAQANRVKFYWAVHLGGAFDGKDEAAREVEYTALFAKLEQMYAGGFRAFAVFFDDFGSNDASLHSEIGNRIVRDFLKRKGDCEPLIVCPNVYSVIGDPYQKTMGEKLDSKAMIMWTGNGVCTDITAADIARITEDLRRQPFIWWNWPVNDYCRAHLLLGRLYGLETEGVAGIVLNPMENVEASKIALHGFAKLIADPASFDSAAVWRSTFDALFSDPRIAARLRIFAEHNSDPGENFAGFRREESASLAEPLAAATKEFDANGYLDEATVTALSARFGEILSAAKTLLKELPAAEPQLYWEIQGWLENEVFLMNEALVALELVRKGAGEDAAAETRKLKYLRALRHDAYAAGERHIAKFQAATFGDDRWRISAPEASPGALKPFVEKLLIGRLVARREAKTGQKYDALAAFKATSTVAAWPNPQVERKGKEAGMKPMLEQYEVRPGEGFVLSLPATWIPSYFHARFETHEPLICGMVEISRDGKTWSRMPALEDGLNAQGVVDYAQRWRWARYRNVSDHPVAVKLLIFKFDVSGAASPLDELLEEDLEP